MIRRNFKFFNINEIPPYNQYVVGDFLANNGGYIRSRTWHWTRFPLIIREEPDGYEREHRLLEFGPITFNEFLERYDHYEIYIYSIERRWALNGNLLTLYAPNNVDHTDLEDLIDKNNDVLYINAILI